METYVCNLLAPNPPVLPAYLPTCLPTCLVCITSDVLERPPPPYPPSDPSSSSRRHSCGRVGTAEKEKCEKRENAEGGILGTIDDFRYRIILLYFFSSPFHALVLIHYSGFRLVPVCPSPSLPLPGREPRVAVRCSYTASTSIIL